MNVLSLSVQSQSIWLTEMSNSWSGDIHWSHQLVDSAASEWVFSSHGSRSIVGCWLIHHLCTGLPRTGSGGHHPHAWLSLSTHQLQRFPLNECCPRPNSPSLQQTVEIIYMYFISQQVQHNNTVITVQTQTKTQGYNNNTQRQRHTI